MRYRQLDSLTDYVLVSAEQFWVEHHASFVIRQPCVNSLAPVCKNCLDASRSQE